MKGCTCDPRTTACLSCGCRVCGNKDGRYGCKRGVCGATEGPNGFLLRDQDIEDAPEHFAHPPPRAPDEAAFVVRAEFRPNVELAKRIMRSVRESGAKAKSFAKPFAFWTEEDGPVLWWKFPVVEPPYVGSPIDDDFPEYVTHWTVIEVPEGGLA